MADGSIDQLNYEIILKDNGFEGKLKELEALAKSFNTNMSNALTINKIKDATKEVDAFKKALEGSGEAQKKLNGEISRMPTQRIRSFSDDVQRANTGLLRTSNLMTTLSQLTGVYFGAVGIRRFLSSLVEVTGQFEVQHMALRNILQDADAADRIFKDLYDFSSRSTYRFSELAKYSKQLAAFNIDKSNLLETTKMLGDVASGLGMSMDRLILAYGHVKSSGFLRGIQLRSFSQNGVPILDELSKMFTEIEGKAVSLGDVFDKMMKRQIPFEMVEEAFRRMTSEGGKFYQMQEVLAKTLSGQINILKGKWENMLYAIGQSEEGFLKGTVQTLTWIVDHMDSIANALKPVIVGLGAYGAAIVAVAAAQKVVGLARFAGEFLVMAKNVGIASASVIAFGSATKAAAGILGLAVTAIAAVAMAVRKTTGEVDKFKKHLADIHDEASDSGAYNEEISKVETLRKILNDTNQSYDARKAALDKLKSIVPQYHADLTEEGRLIHNNTKELDAYIAALNREAKMKGAEDELAELYKERRAIQRELDDRQQTVDKINNAALAPGAILLPGMTPLEQMLAPTKLNNSEKKLALIDKQIENINKEIGETLGEGREVTDGMNYNISSIVEGIKNIDTELAKLRDKARKGSISVTEKENLDALVKEREEQAKLYKDIMGVDYDKDVRRSQKAQQDREKDAEKLRKDQIAGIKKQIEVLRKYREAYEDFTGLLGEEGAQKIVNKLFEPVTNFDFDSQIMDKIEELRSLGDEEGAEGLLASLGLGDANKLKKQLQDVQRVGKQFQNLVQSWKAENMDADSDTFMGKMVKVVSDLDTKSSQLFNKYQKGMQMLRQIDVNDPNQRQAVVNALIDDGMTEEQAAEFWDTFVAKGEAELTQMYCNTIAKFKTEAQRAINELADDYVKNQTKDLNLSDWGDKSIKQVYEIWKALKELAEGEGIDDATRATLEKAQLSIDDFTKLTLEDFQNLSKEAKEELEKKVVSALQTMISSINEAASALGDFAEASGNNGLGQVADIMQGFADFGSSVLKGFASGDWIGAIVAGVASIAKSILNASAEAAKFKLELKAALEEVRAMRYEWSLTEGVSSIFGTDDWTSVQNAVKNIAELRKAMSGRVNADGFQKMNKVIYTLMYLGGKAGGAYDRNRDYLIESYAKELGLLGELYDEYGNLNSKVLQAILEKYPKMSEAQRQYITEAANNAEAYEKALKQVQDVMESIFGDIASSAADTIVDGWIEAKNAALDYSDILDDVAQSYSKMLVKSMVLDTLKDDDSIKKITDAFVNNDTEKAMALIEGKMQEVAALEPAIQAVLQAFDPYFKREDTERQGLSKGIESNFSQDTIDYWSGQLTLLVELSHQGVDQRSMMIDLVTSIRDNMSGTGNSYSADVQTYLTAIHSDTSAMRADLSSMRATLQYMRDHGVRAL